MDFQNFFSARHIGSSDCNLSVESSGSHNGRVEDIHTVGCSHDDNALVHTEAVHLDKHLIQGLLSLIVSTAHTGTTTSGNSIYLINKDNTWRILLGLGKEVSHS